MNEVKCPFCGSKEVSKPTYSKKAFAISMLLLGFPLVFKKKIRLCFDCSKEFVSK